MTILEILAQFVVPPILGAAAALVAPWAKWGVDKRRALRERRASIVDDWRGGLITAYRANRETASRRLAITRTAQWASLRPHVSQAIVEQIEAVGDPSMEDGFAPRDLLSREIARIEKAWKLI